MRCKGINILDWRRFIAITAYVDDSGSEPSSKIFVLGGVALPAGWCARLSEEWKAILDAAPTVEYFKASEVWDHKKGPFRELTDKERETKVFALAECLCDLHPLAVSCSVGWDIFRDFRGRCVLPEYARDPYFFLFYRLIVLMIQMGQRAANPTPVDFIFDEQNKLWDQVISWFPQFRATLPSTMLSYLGKDPEKDDEKTCLPLQAADMFAWYERRNALASLPWQWHRDIQQRLARYHTSMELTEETLMGMAFSFGFASEVQESQ
ncbi:MAG TPA: DUF3800 domain-containing protein [Terracidiphilus sp.]|nr:DUF3800 domain-containing protein [Terracidiphilus sp.]